MVKLVLVIVVLVTAAVDRNVASKCWNIQCPALWAPLCASDGVTYQNECEMSIENCLLKEVNRPPVVKVHSGECKRIYYNSNARLRSSETNVAMPGCKLQILAIHCTEDEFPICGSDGVSYLNSCKFCKGYYGLKAKGVDLRANHLGNCNLNDICPVTSKMGVCPAVYAPVCASDGRTYSNIWAMCAAAYKYEESGKESKLTLVSRGICSK